MKIHAELKCLFDIIYPTLQAMQELQDVVIERITTTIWGNIGNKRLIAPESAKIMTDIPNALSSGSKVLFLNIPEKSSRFSISLAICALSTDMPFSPTNFGRMALNNTGCNSYKEQYKSGSDHHIVCIDNHEKIRIHIES